MPEDVSAESVVREFWRLMGTNDFASVRSVLSDGLVLEWPQSNERIRGADRFARMNAEYPTAGRWRFRINRLVAAGNTVVTQVSVTDGAVSAEPVSFFTVSDGTITRLTEYWPDPYPAPENRRHLTEPIDPEGASDTVFTTDRIVVRRWRETDLEALLAVYGDEDAMRWVDDGRAIAREECVRWQDVTWNNYEKYGYGMFALEEDGKPGVFGFCGIVHPGGQPEPEIKYALLRSHWGRGLATEAVVGLIAYGARSHGLRHIIATTDPANAASHRVLHKAGMERGALQDNGDGSQTLIFQWHERLPPPDGPCNPGATETGGRPSER